MFNMPVKNKSPLAEVLWKVFVFCVEFLAEILVLL